MKQYFFSFLAVFILLFAGMNRITAEEILFDEPVRVVSKITVPIPPDVISNADAAAGEISLYMTAHHEQAGWTVYGKRDTDIYLSDGETTSPLLNRPKAAHYGTLSSGQPVKITFKLPPKARENGMELIITKGLYAMGTQTKTPFRFEVWKGLRPNIEVHVDKMNRNYIVNCTSFASPGMRYVYETSDGRKVESLSPTFRGRFAETPVPVKIKVTVATPADGVIAKEVEAVPHGKTAGAPLPVEDVRVGLCYYNLPKGDRPGEKWEKVPASWTAQAPALQQCIDEETGNLYVLWGMDQDYKAKEPDFLRQLAARNYAFMTIYHDDSPAKLGEYRKALGRLFLQNNIGERSGHIYQGQRAADMFKIPTDDPALDIAANRFTNEFVNHHARREHKKYDYVFSTSGATISDYELAGGMDFICMELYAAGAQNLNFATAEMRGAARKWKPEYWGGWLAHECQTRNVPYDVKQKFDLFTVGLYTEFMMGTSVIVLESGGQQTQAAFKTDRRDRKQPESGALMNDEEYRRLYNNGDVQRNHGFRDPAPTEYRRRLREFYSFIRKNPRDKGTPETNIAMLRGNLDSYIGAFHNWIPAWAQHKTAREQPQWLMHDPEYTWVAAVDVFMPLFEPALKPYANYWLGGTPFGQVDVVGLDDTCRLSDFSRYRLAVMTGWNTMTPAIAKTLDAYVRNGGMLLISLPHFSTRLDREFKRYETDDLLNKGDLGMLIDVRVKGFQTVSGIPSARKPGRIRSNLFKQETVAQAELGNGVEVLATVGGKPYCVAEKRGSGTVILLLGKEYPGKETTALFYKNLLKKIASETRQSVTMGPAAGHAEDVRAVSFAVYPKTVYVLNTDCVSPREVELTVDGKKQTCRLAPAEFRVLRRDGAGK